jgi:hypothetical protein
VGKEREEKRIEMFTAQQQRAAEQSERGGDSRGVFLLFYSFAL